MESGGRERDCNLCHRRHWQVQCWAEAGSFWSWLKVALSDVGQRHVSSHWGCFCSLLVTKTMPHKPSTEVNHCAVCFRYLSLTWPKQTWSFSKSWLRVWREYYLLEEVAEKSSQFTPDLVQLLTLVYIYLLGDNRHSTLKWRRKKGFLPHFLLIHCYLLSFHLQHTYLWDCSVVTSSN